MIMNYKKRSVNVNYTKAKIKPFLNPLFWASSFVVVIFFYGLWQYTQNPDILSRAIGRPSDSESNANNNTEMADIMGGNAQEGATGAAQLNQETLTDDELSGLADIDNITNLLQQNRQLNLLEQATEENEIDLAEEIAVNLIDFDNLSFSFEEVTLNPLLLPGQSSPGDDKNKGQGNFFQQFLKPENLMGSNSLINNTRNQRNTGRIEVIRPQIQLPSLQDLTTRQRSAVEEYNMRQTLENQLMVGGNSGVNANNDPPMLERSSNPDPLPNSRGNTVGRINPNPLPNLNPVITPNPVINPNPVPNLNRVPSVTGVQGNTNMFSPINPQIPQINTTPNLGGININPAPINNNNNINNNSLLSSPPTQNQEPVRNPSGFLYYY
jgi:hypothetical protein